MHTTNDLENIGIFQFESIADAFDDADLFLGNGFSINLCSRLSYNSLFKKFIETLPTTLQKIFSSFKTTNFEFIIQILNNAEIVNKLIGLPTNQIEPLREQLKTGLIKAIRENHPTHEELFIPQLKQLAFELEAFQDIYTTNYDVFTYKTILHTINKYRSLGHEDAYQDYFYKELSPTQLEFEDSEAITGARSIYYLHGALFLFPTLYKSNVWKLRKFDTSLEYISLIGREIENNNFPTFVAEGDFHDKKARIAGNPYLQFCSNKLLKAYRNLIVFGFSFGPSDRHIADYIERSKIEKIGVSIYVGNKSLSELDKEASVLRQTITKKEVAIFDSATLFSSLHRYS